MTVYRNNIGGLEPLATISHFGGHYGRGGYLTLSTTATNNPHEGMRWPPEAIAEIVQWAEANGYDIEEERDGYGAYRATLIHRETQAAKDSLAAGSTVGYIRFGSLPGGGKSRNHLTGEFEDGVSCYEAIFRPDGSFELLAGPDSLRSLASGGLLTRPAYRLWGEVVGKGSDGEPVLRVKRIERI
jgi:hypothetical protein